MTAHPFGQFLAELSGNAPPPVTVESCIDPNDKNRTGYQLQAYGPGSREAVQAEMDRLMATVDTALGGVAGAAEFHGPFRCGLGAVGWAAIGVVTVSA